MKSNILLSFINRLCCDYNMRFGSWQHIRSSLTCSLKRLLKNLKISVFSLPINISSIFSNNMLLLKNKMFFFYHVATHHAIFPNKCSNCYRIIWYHMCTLTILIYIFLLWCYGTLYIGLYLCIYVFPCLGTVWGILWYVVVTQ